MEVEDAGQSHSPPNGFPGLYNLSMSELILNQELKSLKQLKGKRNPRVVISLAELNKVSSLV